MGTTATLKDGTPMSQSTPPGWKSRKLLPKHCKFISGRKGNFLYRENGSQWQVIVVRRGRSCTLYNGHWPDVPDISLERALELAEVGWAL